MFDVQALMGIPQLIDITLGFAWAGTPHYFYEIGDVGSLGEAFALPVGVAPPLGSANVGGGTYWVPTSTNPPGVGVWPNGAQTVQLVTDDSQASGRHTGTMRRSNAGAQVYRATDIVIWIPTAAIGPGAALGAPTPMIWRVDF